MVVWDAPSTFTPPPSWSVILEFTPASAAPRRRLIVKNEQHEELIGQIVKLAERLMIGDRHASPARYGPQ